MRELCGSLKDSPDQYIIVCGYACACYDHKCTAICVCTGCDCGEYLAKVYGYVTTPVSN